MVFFVAILIIWFILLVEDEEDENQILRNLMIWNLFEFWFLFFNITFLFRDYARKRKIWFDYCCLLN